MKKSIFTMLILFLTISMVAQKGGPEKPAKKAADKMTEVLVLNDTESKQVYEIQLEKFTQAQAIKAANTDDKDKAKAEVKKVNSNAQKELKSVIGEEKMTEWKKYLKDNKKKK